MQTGAGRRAGRSSTRNPGFALDLLGQRGKYRSALTFLVLNLALHVVDGVRRLHFQGDGLSCQCLYEDLHSVAWELIAVLKLYFKLFVLVGNAEISSDAIETCNDPICTFRSVLNP